VHQAVESGSVKSALNKLSTGRVVAGVRPDVYRSSH